jgi:very-short-patch-repair endonuclease
MRSRKPIDAAEEARRAALRRKREFATRLRVHGTAAEWLLWRQFSPIRRLGFDFRRQIVLLGWIVDLYCRQAKVAVEIDGPYHENRRVEDAQRDAALLRGLDVVTLRYTNDQVLADPVAVVAAVYEVCLQRTGREREPFRPRTRKPGDTNPTWASLSKILEERGAPTTVET